MVTKREIKGIEQQLAQERDDLLKQLAELESQSLSVPQSESSGDPSFDDDYADAGTATFERERDFSIAQNMKDILEKVEHALERIKDGSYGTCEVCQKPIEPDRLTALPHATMCISCKKRDEAHR